MRFWTAALLLLLAWPGTAPAQPVPTYTGEQRVQHWTNAFITTCRASGGRATAQPGYQTRADMNGDGAPDFILDARRMACAGAPQALCPNGPCSLLVLLSGPEGGQPALSKDAWGWTLDSASSPPALLVQLPPGGCGTVRGACTQRFQWNGTTMAQAATAAPPAASPPAAGTGPRPEIVVRSQAETMAACRDSGGRPVAGAAFETQVDLNADGVPDYVQDATHMDCQGAVSALCGSAGCPLGVFVSSPGGHRAAFSGHAQAWEIERTSTPPVLVLHLHGSACGRAGSETCTKRYAWNGRELAELRPGARPQGAPPPAPPAAGTSPGAASQMGAPTSPAPAPAPEVAAAPRGWETRPVANRAPVAVTPGPGAVETLALLCHEGVPVAAFTLKARPPQGRAAVTFAFPQARVDLPITLPEGATNRVWYADLTGSEVPRLLATRSGNVRLLVAGAIQGNLALESAGPAVRAALSGCYRF